MLALARRQNFNASSVYRGESGRASQNMRFAMCKRSKCHCKAKGVSGRTDAYRVLNQVAEILPVQNVAHLDEFHSCNTQTLRFRHL